MAGLSLLWRNSMINYLIWQNVLPILELEIETDCILDAYTGLAI